LLIYALEQAKKIYYSWFHDKGGFMINGYIKKSSSYKELKNIIMNEASNIIKSFQMYEIMHKALLTSDMYGQYTVYHESSDFSRLRVKPVEAVSLGMKEALEYWKLKVPVNQSEFYGLSEQYRVNAFTVSGLGSMDLILDMYKSLENALQNGTSLGEWKKSYSSLWEQKGWTGKSAWRVDNIFRTNIQTAYNVGRYKQMQRVVEIRPYWMYDAVNDSRTRPTHYALNLKVFPHDHEFWDIFYPPNGFRCRCTVQTLSKRQVEQRELQIEKLNPYGGLIEPVDPKTNEKMPARPLMPDRGFEGNPAKQHYKPDLDKYPKWLKEAFENLKKNVDRDLQTRTGTDNNEFIKDLERLVKFTKVDKLTFELVELDSFMRTTSKGKIFISTKTFKDRDNFKPLDDLKSALKKKKNLTFNEEYALEALWHEIIHNNQNPGSAKYEKTNYRTVIMETVNQWLARRTYIKMLDELGIKSKWADEIKSKGYGYNAWVKNFDYILKKLYINDDDSLLNFISNMHDKTPRYDYIGELSQHIVKRGRYSIGTIKKLLKNIESLETIKDTLKSVDDRTKIKQHLKKLDKK